MLPQWVPGPLKLRCKFFIDNQIIAKVHTKNQAVSLEVSIDSSYLCGPLN
jgi:hypothetical protein